MVEAERLNADCHAAGLNQAALQQVLQAQGDAWYRLIKERCPHLFADAAVFITAVQLQQMHDVISAVERVVALPGWRDAGMLPQPHGERVAARGVFLGYDFHLNADGAHLIEINTNAGGGFLNALLLGSQRDSALPGKAVAVENLEQSILDMFLNEWRLARGDAPLKAIAIVDERPEEQYLFPEFMLAKSLFERAGITTHIVDPAELQVRDDGLYCNDKKIDLVYNRLTDFSLQKHLALQQEYLSGQVVLTPHPYAYVQYADKRNLARLTDAQYMHALGTDDADIATLQTGIPHTIVVVPELEESLWATRKQWFFKPVTGYGGKGAYRGEKLTRRVFGEIMHGEYVAQKLAIPGERAVCMNEAEVASLKFDVRCYVYDGQVQLVAARLYQGQTTNFRTPGGGFAPVRLVGLRGVE